MHHWSLKALVTFPLTCSDSQINEALSEPGLRVQMKKALVTSRVAGFIGFPVGVGHFLASGHPLPPAFRLRIETGCPERSVHVTFGFIQTTNQCHYIAVMWHLHFCWNLIVFNFDPRNLWFYSNNQSMSLNCSVYFFCFLLIILNPTAKMCCACWCD